MANIQIKSGKHGWILCYKGYYIAVKIDRYGDSKTVVIKCVNGIPNGATEWVSIQALRAFWHKNLLTIDIICTMNVVKSEWGQLISIK